MPNRSYDYAKLNDHPKVLAFLLGWLGQKVVWLTHQAFIEDSAGRWDWASREVYRICHLCRQVESGDDAEQKRMLSVTGWYGQNGFWVSEEGREYRRSLHKPTDDLYPFLYPDCGDGLPEDSHFFPRLPDVVGAPGKTFAAVAESLYRLIERAAATLKCGGGLQLGLGLAGHCFSTSTSDMQANAKRLLEDMLHCGLISEADAARLARLPQPAPDSTSTGPPPLPTSGSSDPQIPRPPGSPPRVGRHPMPRRMPWRVWLVYQRRLGHAWKLVCRHSGLGAVPNWSDISEEDFRQESVESEKKARAMERGALRPCDEKALAQYNNAIQKSDPKVNTDREAYDWITSRLEVEGGARLPSFATWSKYVRVGRQAHGLQKHQPRTGRPHGSSTSIVPVSGIELWRRPEVD